MISSTYARDFITPTLPPLFPATRRASASCGLVSSYLSSRQSSLSELCEMSSRAMIFLVLLLICAVNARSTTTTTTPRPVPDYYEPDEEDLSTTEAAYAEGCYVCGDYR